MIEQLIWLFLLVALPLGFMMAIRPQGRLGFFVVGLIACAGWWLWLPDVVGPRNPMILYPFFGLYASLIAIVAEILVRSSRLAKRLNAKRLERHVIEEE